LKRFCKSACEGAAGLLLAAVLPAGAAVCGSCHPEITASYAQTAMARSSGPVDADAELPGEFTHAASSTRYRIVADHGTLELHWPGGRVELDLYIGSRLRGRSYAWQEAGFFYEVPAGYYTARRAWDSAPGYEHDRRLDLDRPLTADCLFCHAGNVRLAPQTVNRILNWREVRGVPCERCHGDGAAHAAHPRRDNIVNPARLAPPLRDAVCEQCHLAGEARVRRPGRQLENFRPGEPLADYLAVYLAGGDARGVSVNGHAEALARSRCRQSGPGLWCGTCHDPHRPVAAAGYREKCLACHAARDCPSPARDQQDCVLCHMPKSRAYDGGHTTFTDHSIPRRPREPAVRPGAPTVLVPYYGSSTPRDLGLAWFQVAEKYAEESLYAKAWPPLREALAGGSADAELYVHAAYLLERDGRGAQAEALYRRALEMEPANPAALANLGFLVSRRGLQKEAAEYWERALHANPRQPAVRRALER